MRRYGQTLASDSSRRTLYGAGISGVLLCAIAAFWLGGDTIRRRINDTREQIEAMQEMGNIGQRARLYQDTWNMAKERPVAGWGLESYAAVYPRISTEPKTVEGWTVRFKQAHSDWLQLFAETGLVGVALLLSTLIVPLWVLRHRLLRDPFPGCLLICLGWLALYAWIEFPFANPAVTLSAWVAFYSAIRHLQLEHQIRSHHSSTSL